MGLSNNTCKICGSKNCTNLKNNHNICCVCKNKNNVSDLDNISSNSFKVYCHACTTYKISNRKGKANYVIRG